MLRRLRHSLRVRLVEAVQDGTRAELGSTVGDVAALRDEVRGLHERLSAVETGLRDQLQAWETRTRRDVLTAMDQDAMRSSAEFLRTEMGSAQPYFDKFDTLRAALSHAPPEGLFLEFGVASGSTLTAIVEKAPPGMVHGFDSFQGLPEDWRPGFPAGSRTSG